MICCYDAAARRLAVSDKLAARAAAQMPGGMHGKATRASSGSRNASLDRVSSSRNTSLDASTRSDGSFNSVGIMVTFSDTNEKEYRCSLLSIVQKLLAQAWTLTVIMQPAQQHPQSLS
jgi:hypothetical protein